MLAGLSLLVLAFALSLDGFGVGMMYGLRKIKIGPIGITIISISSGLVIYASMWIGAWMTTWFSTAMASRIGAILLIGIGIWALIQLFMQKSTAEVEASSSSSLVLQILRTPAAADVDRSGNISSSEAILLGLALSLDAFGAGIGAALIGLNPLITASVIAVSSGVFLSTGIRFGLRFSDMNWMKKLTFLPGCVLILIGMVKLLQ